MTRLRHDDTVGTARFVTFSTYRRIPALDDDELKLIVVSNLASLRDKHLIKILGYVLMPDHVHLVLHPPATVELGRAIGQLKSLSAREYFASRVSAHVSGTRILWQPRRYDHNCRDTESVIEKINYCHDNPVKKGIVPAPGEWQWSSYSWCRGEENVSLKIDSVEM